MFCYPNPFHESCVVTFPDGSENCTLTILNETGKIISENAVQNQKSMMLNRNSFDHGINFLVLRYPSGKMLTAKLVCY
jgi:hypothetical protein